MTNPSQHERLCHPEPVAKYRLCVCVCVCECECVCVCVCVTNVKADECGLTDSLPFIGLISDLHVREIFSHFLHQLSWSETDPLNVVRPVCVCVCVCVCTCM